MPLRRGGKEESLVVELVIRDGIVVCLENGKRVSLDFKHDGGRGALIAEGDEAAINYFPKSVSAVVNTVAFTVKRDGKEIFRDNISANRIITG